MIEIKRADKSNFGLDSFKDFNRFQVVKNVYRQVGNRLILIENPFTEDWSPARKVEKATEILSGEFVTFCAFDGGRVVGEIMLVPTLNDGRLIVDSFHVSGDCRRRGIGRSLFNTAADYGRKLGARAIYMSCCSAEETIKFYVAMGCVISPSPIPEYAEDEPCDIQMECAI